MKERILENIYNSKRNVIINGDMSTGKTKNLGYNFVDKIIASNESLFILDSREEYLNHYYNTLKANDYNIIIINMKDFYKSEGWNLLEYPYTLYKNNNYDNAIKYLNNITQEIFRENSNADPFWLNSASDYFMGITLALFEDAKANEINLSSINSIINDSDTKISYIAEYFRTKDKTDMAYICASGTVFSPVETSGGIIATAKQKLLPILNKQGLTNMSTKTTFNYNEILTKKSAIFFLNSEEDSTLSSLTSVFITQLYSILTGNKNKRNFNFILDNFDTINNISNLKGILSSCISNNIKFYIFTRDKENLDKQYSNYINKVSNTININEREITITINGQQTELSNEFNEVKENDYEITYPSLPKKEINIFNLKKHILENIKLSKDEN